MFIHKIISGKRTKCVKFLLRHSIRDGRKVRKVTLANLTHWSETDRCQLELALKTRRKCKGTILQDRANQRAYVLLAKCISPFQLLALLSGGTTLRSQVREHQSYRGI